MMNKLDKIFRKIGKQLMSKESYAIYKNYPDLECNYNKGIVPRGLIYEPDGYKKNVRGCVIVGINPGKAKKGERDFFRQNQITYDSFLKYWKENIADKKYYHNLRAFVKNNLKLQGPILWTELVKCECQKNGILFLQTIRDDIHRWLFKELEFIPKDWPLIGVGNRAYEILSYSFPKRLVIGIPHINARGNFFEMLGNKKIIVKFRKAIIKGEKISISCFKNE